MRLSPAFLESLMDAAIAEAERAAQSEEVPVGAVIAVDDTIIARAHNTTEQSCDCSAHAEMLALRQAACATGNWRLSEAILCVTLEPCTMCIGAIRLARIPVLVFGASDPSLGAVGSLYNLGEDPRLGAVPRIIQGVRSAACGELLSEFFRSRR